MPMPPEDIEQALSALIQSSQRMRTTIADLHAAGADHATRCTAVASRLDGARVALKVVRDDGESLRTTHKLCAELDGVGQLIGGGALRKCIPMLEDIARRTFNSGDDGSAPASSRAAAAFSSVVHALATALEAEWHAWTRSGCEALFHGARALALAPPGGLSAGIDGLDAARSALEQANAHLSDAERADELLALTARTSAAETPSGTPPTARNEMASKCHAIFHADVASRLTAELQTACRLAAHATSTGTAEAAVLLEAVAEAAATSAKASRSVASVFGLLPPSPPPHEGGPDAAEAAGSAEATAQADTALTHELATATDTLLAQLRALPPPTDAGRASALGALGTGACDLLRRELDISAKLISAAQGTRGRRALSVLGEAGERLAAAALTQARAES